MVRKSLLIALVFLGGCAAGSALLYVEPNPDSPAPGYGYVDFFIATPTVECVWQVNHLRKGKNLWGESINEKVRVDSHAYLAEIAAPASRQVRASATPGQQHFSITATPRVFSTQKSACSNLDVTVAVYDGLITPVRLRLGERLGGTVIYDPFGYQRKELTPYFDKPGDAFELELIKLAAKANPDFKRENGTTALIRAAMEGRADIVRILLDARANPDLALEDGNSALLLALARKHWDVAKMLVTAGANSNVVNKSGVSALLSAAQQGSIDLVKSLLQSGAKVNASLPDRSVLAVALENKHPEIGLVLMDAGAEIQVTDKDKASPLTIAAKLGYAEIVKAMLDRRPELASDLPTWNSALSRAIDENHADVVRELLRAFPGRDRQLDKAELAHAVAKGNSQIVELLLANKIDVNQTTENGTSTLMVAAAKNLKDIARLLIKAKAPINSSAKDGSTALMYAAESGSIEIVRELIANKANPNARSVNGVTALDVAKEKEHSAIAEMLAPITSAQPTIYTRMPTAAAAKTPSVSDPVVFHTLEDGLISIKTTLRTADEQVHVTDVVLRAPMIVSNFGASARGKIVSGTLITRDAAGSVLPLTAGMSREQLLNEARARKVSLTRIGFAGFRIGEVTIYFEDGNVGDVAVGKEPEWPPK